MEKEIRILPMSKKEFNDKSIEWLQGWFMEELKNARKGLYRYKTRGLKTSTGSLILFQYRGKIIASAVFLNSERYEKAYIESKTKYNGFFEFDPNSITVFMPISNDEFNRIYEVKFNNVKYKIPYNKLQDMLTLIEAKKLV
jgi:hypothetical protein